MTLEIRSIKKNSNSRKKSYKIDSWKIVNTYPKLWCVKVKIISLIISKVVRRYLNTLCGHSPRLYINNYHKNLRKNVRMLRLARTFDMLECIFKSIFFTPSEQVLFTSKFSRKKKKKKTCKDFKKVENLKRVRCVLVSIKS